MDTVAIDSKRAELKIAIEPFWPQAFERACSTCIFSHSVLWQHEDVASRHVQISNIQLLSRMMVENRCCRPCLIQDRISRVSQLATGQDARRQIPLLPGSGSLLLDMVIGIVQVWTGGWLQKLHSIRQGTKEGKESRTERLSHSPDAFTHRRRLHVKEMVLWSEYL